MELKHRELKDREEKIKREIKELFFKPSIVSKDDADKFGEKKKKIRPIKKSWYDQLNKLWRGKRNKNNQRQIKR